MQLLLVSVRVAEENVHLNCVALLELREVDGWMDGCARAVFALVHGAC